MNQSVMKNHTGSVSALPTMMPHVWRRPSRRRAGTGPVARGRVGSGGRRRLAIRQDVGPLLGGDPGMALGRVVEPPEQHDPEQAERAGDDEHRPPRAEGVEQPRHEHQGDRRADRRSAVEQRDRPAALAPREPLGDGLGRTRPVGRLAGAEQEAEAGERLQADGQRRQHRRHRVPQHRDRQPLADADAIEPLAATVCPIE